VSAEHWAQGIKLAGDIDADESHVYFSSQSELQVSFQNLIKTMSEEYQSVAQCTVHIKQTPAETPHARSVLQFQK
jgi:hypothetical protein